MAKNGKDVCRCANATRNLHCAISLFFVTENSKIMHLSIFYVLILPNGPIDFFYLLMTKLFFLGYKT